MTDHIGFQTCNCLTKTPEPSYHKENCPVYMEWKLHRLQSLVNENFVIRANCTLKEVLNEVDLLKQAVQVRLDRHGYGLASGSHETYGILAEEMKEYLDEVHANSLDGCYDELVDIAVAAIYGMVSITKRKEFIKQKSEE